MSELKIIKSTEFQTVGTLNGSDKKLVHVGYKGTVPQYLAIAEPKEADTKNIVTLNQILKFNPEGWVINNTKVKSIEENIR